jgi:protein-disulfide isomerase
MNPDRVRLQFAEYGEQIGSRQILACLKENADLDAINADLEAGRRVGLQATPSFVINGYLVSGALPIEAFRAIINKFTSK